MTTQTHPIRQSAGEDLRNALQIAEFFGESTATDATHGHRIGEAIDAFQSIGRLLRHAISQLGEPSLEAVQATEVMLREWEGSREPRNVRDVAAVILHAAMTGQIPPTWNERELPDPEFPEYICPKCGEPHGAHARTPEDRLCFSCRYPESEPF